MLFLAQLLAMLDEVSEEHQGSVAKQKSYLVDGEVLLVVGLHVLVTRGVLLVPKERPGSKHDKHHLEYKQNDQDSLEDVVLFIPVFDVP